MPERASMTDVITTLKLVERNYLGLEQPFINNKIEFGPWITDEDVQIVIQTLYLFDGPSLGKLDLQKHFRSELVWKNLGKLSLKNRKGMKSLLPQIADKLLTGIGFSAIYKAHALVGAAHNKIKGVSQISQHNFGLDLTLDRADKNSDIISSIGTLSVEASQLKSLLDEQEEIFGKVLAEYGLEKLPMVLVTHTVDIIREKIDQVLRTPHDTSAKYPHNPLVLRENIGLDLNPRSEERV